MATVEAEIVADIPEWAEGLLEPHRYKVLYGGRGGAKSWAFARVLLAKGHQQPLRILCAREIQNSIKDSVHKLLSDQARAMGLPYTPLETEIRHPNGTVFLFKGLRSNPESLMSAEAIDIVWVAQAERVAEESWRKLIPTIRNKGSEIWLDLNPDLEDDPTYQRFIVHPPPNTWSLEVSWKDNPWFHETELPAEKDHDYAVDPDAADNTWGGKCRQASDAQILRGKWVVEAFEPQPGWSGPYHGLDFGFALNPTVAGKLWVATESIMISGKPIKLDTLYVERDACKIGLELDDTAGFIERHIPGYEGFVSRADSSRPESISYLKRHGLPKIIPCTKWPGSIEDGIAHLRQYVRIVIHPRCERAIFEAKHYSYEVDKRTGDVLPEVRDLHNDFCLAAGTLVTTKRGAVPIEKVAGGDLAWTRKGWRRVLSAGMTNPAAQISALVLDNGTVLRGTGSHPVWCARAAFARLDSLRYTDRVLFSKDALCGNTTDLPRSSRTTVSSIAATRSLRLRVCGITSSAKTGERHSADASSTATSGRMPTAQFPQNLTCTTKTETRQTTGLRTWKRSHGASTRPSIVRRMCNGGNALFRSTAIECAPPPHCGTNQTRGGRGIGSTRTEASPSHGSMIGTVLSAVRNSWGALLNLRSVRTLVSLLSEGRRVWIMRSARARGAAPTSLPTVTPAFDSALVRVRSVREEGVTGAVYNLSVEGENEFFANGILVHNCDAMRYALGPLIRARPRRSRRQIPTRTSYSAV